MHWLQKREGKLATPKAVKNSKNQEKTENVNSLAVTNVPDWVRPSTLHLRQWITPQTTGL